MGAVRPFDYDYPGTLAVSRENFALALEAEGMIPEIADFVAGIDAVVAQGAPDQVSQPLSLLIRRPTTPLAEVVARAVIEYHH